MCESDDEAFGREQIRSSGSVRRIHATSDEDEVPFQRSRCASPMLSNASRFVSLAMAGCFVAALVVSMREGLVPQRGDGARSAGARGDGGGVFVGAAVGDGDSFVVASVLSDVAVEKNAAAPVSDDEQPPKPMGRWQQLRFGINICLAAPDDGTTHAFTLGCDAADEKQHWSYDQKAGVFKSLLGKCLELAHINVNGSPVDVAPCNPQRMQSWLWDSTGQVHARQKWNDASGRLRVQVTTWCLVTESGKALVRRCGERGGDTAAAQLWALGDTPLPPRGCGDKRFNVPPAPMKATGHNGARVVDACFDWRGPNQTAHVFVIGDWGGVPTPQGPRPADHRARKFGVRWRPFTGGVDDRAQILVARQMALRAPVSKPDYVLNVGDNFYWAGIGDPASFGNGAREAITCNTHALSFLQAPLSMQWATCWDAVYRGPYLSGLQWLGVLGNHDYGGFVFNADWHQSIGYTWMSGGRWVTPAQYWRTKAWYPNFSVDYYFVDSNFVDALPPDVDPEHNMCSRMHNPPDAKCGLTGPANVDDCHGWFQTLWADQIRWLEGALSRSAAEWQIVVTHFPPSFAQDVWVALSKRFGIDLIIVGHAHFQSVTYDPAGPFGLTGVVISGGGGGITSEAPPSMDGDDDQYGFVDLAIGRDQIYIESISHGGQVRSTTTVKPRYPDEGAPLPILPATPPTASKR